MLLPVEGVYNIYLSGRQHWKFQKTTYFFWHHQPSGFLIDLLTFFRIPSIFCYYSSACYRNSKKFIYNHLCLNSFWFWLINIWYSFLLNIELADISYLLLTDLFCTKPHREVPFNNFVNGLFINTFLTLLKEKFNRNHSNVWNIQFESATLQEFSRLAWNCMHYLAKNSELHY